MEEEMIKWFIDNLKPPYYEKIINAQVTIRKHIDEGISSEKVVDLETLSSMIE